MSIKLNKSQESKLNCICGTCDHTFSSTNCLYNQILSASDPGEKQKKMVLAFIEELLKEKAPKKSCDKMTAKKGKTCQKKNISKSKN